MKKFILLFVLMLGTSAWACPDLSGNYMCDQEKLSVATYEVNGVIYYEFNGSAMPADSQWYEIPDSENEKNAQIRLECDTNNTYGEHARLDYVGDIYENGDFAAKLNAQVYLYLDGTSFKQITLGTAKNAQGEHPISSEITCTKI